MLSANTKKFVKNFKIFKVFKIVQIVRIVEMVEIVLKIFIVETTKRKNVKWKTNERKKC
jgi:hypothetical protein